MTARKAKNFWIILTGVLAAVPAASYAASFNPFNEKFFDDLGSIMEASSGESGGSRVVNHINVSSNTGNNVISKGTDPPGDKFPGEAKEGEAKTSVEIKSIINGKELDPIEIKSEAGEVKVKSEIEADGEKAQVQRETEIDSVKKSESYEVDLNGAKSDAAKAESLSETENSTRPDKKETINKNSEKISRSLVFLRDQWMEFIERVKKFFSTHLTFLS